jgi:hypothetical protein
MPVRGRPVSLWLLLLLLVQLSIRAFVGGGALLVAPAGTLVGLPTGPLESTPFRDFVFPGLVLLLVFGLLPASVCYGLYAKREWAWPAAMTVALALLLWILVEIMVGFSRPTIYLNLGTALGIGGVAMYPAVRHHLRATTA